MKRGWCLEREEALGVFQHAIYKKDNSPKKLIIQSCSPKRWLIIFEEPDLKLIPEVWQQEDIEIDEKKVKLATSNKQYIRCFIDKINKYEQLGDIQDIILARLGLQSIEKELTEKILQLFKDNENQKAMNLLIENQPIYYALAWNISQQLEQQGSMEDTVCTIVNLITLDNSCYKKAQAKLLSLLYVNKLDCNRSQLNLPLEELGLKYALGSENQTMIDAIFHKLCGKDNQLEIISPIKGELETLLKLAESFRNLSQQKAEKLPNSPGFFKI